MDRISEKMGPVHNIGLGDRMVRFFGGGALMAFGVIYAVVAGWSVISAAAVLLAVYPLMTTMMGWDPIYELFGAKTCTLEGGRNQCGTLPYEVDAALGHDPKPVEGHEYDHSLTAAQHAAQIRQPQWRKEKRASRA